MYRVKKIILRLPLLGYLLRILSSVAQLPNRLKHIENGQHHAWVQQQALDKKLFATDLRLIELLQELNPHIAKEKELVEIISDIKSRLNSVGASYSAPNNAETTNRIATFADDHTLDDFYLKFENKFRGTEDMIIERLQVYLPYFAERAAGLKKLPVLDIGSGRGEFLDMLTNAKIKVRGLDINSEMVKRSIKKGFDTVEGDALSYLAKQKRNSFSAVSGFHIVEHIPFPELMKIFNECFRVTANGGIVIFETPNPENLTVGSLNFNYDPSHLKPIPPQLLAFCLEYTGFTNIEILPLHPEKVTNNPDENVQEALSRLFGPRDYAVIAKKA
jgi:SAM-dependent methyltransferase